MALSCVSTRELDAWKETRSEIWDYWVSKKNVEERFMDHFNREFKAQEAMDAMKFFISERLELPYDRDFPMSDTLVKRIKVEMDSFNNALKGSFGNFVMMVPEGLSKGDPTARKFYLKLNEILNYERVQINNVSSVSAEIANHLSEGFFQMHEVTGSRLPGGKKYLGNQALNELRQIRKEMATGDPSEATVNKWDSKVQDLINSDRGVTLKQFHELIRMNSKEFKSVREPNYVNPNGQKVTYNGEIYQAAKKSRQLLDSVGNVYIRGLENLKKIVALKYTNNSDWKAAMTNRKAKYFIEKIDNSVAGIKEGMKKGGYFPEIAFENMMTIKEGLSKAMAANEITKDFRFNNLVDDILSKVSLESIPDHAKGKNPNVKKAYEQDPLLVLKEYGDQATQFNKGIFTQIEYLEALKQIPRMKHPTKFIKGLKQFIGEEYAIFTRGMSDRPAWANSAVRALNAVQTARTMGLNITGAIKNAASAINYYTRIGLGGIIKTREAINSSQGMKEGFAETLKSVESEAGFLFKDAARELYTEGLITRDQFDTGEIEYNPIKGTITHKGKPVRNALTKLASGTLDKLLFFHRLTENNQRLWMFRTSFHGKYSELINNGYSEARARNFAKNFALKTVNGWAYEYAAHAKARPVRGQWGTVEQLESGTISRRLQNVAGAGSEVAFHLLHYPMSLFESQWSTVKGAHKAILAGQGFQSPDIQHLARYAGAMTLMGLSSVALNTNLFNIFENESAQRISRVVDDLTEYDNPDKGTFGLMSEFTGPTLGMMKYMAIAGGLLDIKHNDLNKILFGNVDFFDPTDAQTELYNAYQFSTAYGVLQNKVIPSIANGRGRDLIMHYGKLYPTWWTKAAHEKAFGRKPKKKKKQAKITSQTEAVRILDMMLKGR